MENFSERKECDRFSNTEEAAVGLTVVPFLLEDTITEQAIQK
jgi:hypothetical protein